jgi:alpha-L-rhamnosidase
MDEGWQAEWITPDCEDNRIHPILCQHFDLPSRAVAARAYICRLGLYHFELNGKKVGDEYFMPYCNAYDQWIQYQTFDITDQLVVGSNLVSVMLGNGWYKGRYGANGGAVGFYGEILVHGYLLREGEQIGNTVELTLGAGCHKIEYLIGEKEMQS